MHSALPGGRLVIAFALLRIASGLVLVMAGVGLLISALWGRRATAFAAIGWIAINVLELLVLSHQDVAIALVLSVPALVLLASVRGIQHDQPGQPPGAK